MDERLNKLADTIVNYSLKVKKDECVLITYQTEIPKPLVKILIQKLVEKKVVVFTRMLDPEITTLLTELTDKNRLDIIREHSKFDVEHFDCFINIHYTTNDYENNKIDEKITKMIGEVTEEYDDIRINQRRWVLLNYPSKLDAYKAKMKTEDFYNYAFDVMSVDYSDMYDKAKPLKELMEKTDQVRIVGPNTDITFSIKGLPAVICAGESNIPDGEVFTAPIKDSVNGVIQYNTKSPYQGHTFSNIRLTFENGKIIKAESDDNSKKLEEIFNTDEGARYIGEFSLGLNPLIKDPMGDILYDEKIIGSLHFTPGRAYQEAFNGNESNVHWDLVLIQREEYGGGEIYFDHTLIRKDGKFVLPELQHLNYDLK